MRKRLQYAAKNLIQFFCHFLSNGSEVWIENSYIYTCLWSRNSAKDHFMNCNYHKVTKFINLVISHVHRMFAARKAHHICAAEKHRHSSNIINNFPITVSTWSAHHQLSHMNLISFRSFNNLDNGSLHNNNNDDNIMIMIIIIIINSYTKPKHNKSTTINNKLHVHWGKRSEEKTLQYSILYEQICCHAIYLRLSLKLSHSLSLYWNIFYSLFLF